MGSAATPAGGPRVSRNCYQLDFYHGGFMAGPDKIMRNIVPSSKVGSSSGAWKEWGQSQNEGKMMMKKMTNQLSCTLFLCGLCLEQHGLCGAWERRILPQGWPCT